MNKFSGSIRFENVHFTYPTRKNAKVLNGLTLDIKSGQTVALVGASGSGKSTVIQLIQRFYDADDGRVRHERPDLLKRASPSHNSTSLLIGPHRWSGYSRVGPDLVPRATWCGVSGACAVCRLSARQHKAGSPQCNR